MNAVIDEDLHRSLKLVLEALGFTVFDVCDHGLRGCPDSEIFSFAKQKKAVLFTADLGFANILQFPPGTHPGIVVLRFPNELSTQLINQRVFQLLSQLNEENYRQNTVIVTPSQLRIRSNKH